MVCMYIACTEISFVKGLGIKGHMLMEWKVLIKGQCEMVYVDQSCVPNNTLHVCSDLSGVTGP